MTFTSAEVRAYYSSRVPGLKFGAGKESRCPCPVHQGKDLNFAVNAETGLAQCHSQCGRGFDVISLEMALGGLDFPRAKERVYELVGRPKVPWDERDVVATYDYTDSKGNVLYQVMRKFDKSFPQRHPDGNGGWVWGLNGVAKVPFHLPQMFAAEFVAICEGERDVFTLESLGLVASCNSGGAGKFWPEIVPYFTGKAVAVFADNDQPGRDHALKVAAALSPVARSVKIVELPNLPAKGDVTDFVNAGGTIEQIRELYKAASLWTQDWAFADTIPNENDRFVRDLGRDIEDAGGITEFWNLSRLTGIETPWPKLSRALGGGFRNGEVYVLGANQGAGKTSMALQFVMAVIQRSEGVLLFSMEMGWRAIFQRMASIKAQVNLNTLRDAQFVLRKKSSTPTERIDAQGTVSSLMPTLCKATAELAQLPLLVSTKPSVTPEYIATETERLTKKTKIAMVVVDHMQLMGTTGSVRGDYEKFTAISRAIKQTSVEIGVPIVLVSQTSRNQSKEKRTELEVWDLRGSGALEEDAAAVLLLYEDQADGNQALAEGNGQRYTLGPVKCWLKLGKNRYGEQRRCFEFQHSKGCTRFDPPKDVATADSSVIWRGATA